MARFLIADDSLFMRRFIGEILKKAGHDVIAEAKNGEEAVFQYVEVSPDIVTLDITMEKMNGIEALKKIKEIDPRARVIMCSSISHQFNVIEAMKTGASDFIAKPIQEEVFLEVIKKIIKS